MGPALWVRSREAGAVHLLLSYTLSAVQGNPRLLSWRDLSAMGGPGAGG